VLVAMRWAGWIPQLTQEEPPVDPAQPQKQCPHPPDLFFLKVPREATGRGVRIECERYDAV